jgi:phosphoglycolate phosphatase
MFDLAGTTVDDRQAGASLVVSALVRAFARAGISIQAQAVHRHRGKEKIEAIQSILEAEHLVGHAAQIQEFFLADLNGQLGMLVEIDSAADVFRELKERGIRVAVGSGFPTDIVERIVMQMGWKEAGLIDYAGSAEQVGAGRPDPKMIRHAMHCLSIVDPKRVLKVGDTMADIEEGRNAGVWTVGVLTGSQSKEDLVGAGADFVLPSIREVPGLLT